jgi:hypothetical protein
MKQCRAICAKGGIMESKPLSQRPVRCFSWLSVPLITVALYALTTVIRGMSYNLAEQVASPLMRFDPISVSCDLDSPGVSSDCSVLLIALLALVLRKKVPDFGFNKNELRFSVRSVLLSAVSGCDRSHCRIFLPDPAL